MLEYCRCRLSDTWEGYEGNARGEELLMSFVVVSSWWLVVKKM